MLNVYNRKIKSYASMEHVFDKYPTIVKSTLVLDNSVQTFKGKLRAIEAFVVPEKAGTIPITQDKLDKLKHVALNANEERNALLLYAQQNGMPELASKMPRIESEMNDGSYEERIKRYQTIHTAAVDVGEALFAYGCEPETVADQTIQLPLLRTKLNTTRNADSDRMSDQVLFEAKYTDMDEFIKATLDKAVMTRKKGFPAFVVEYREAKVMPKSPVRSKNDPAPKKPSTTNTKEEVKPDETVTETEDTTTTPDVTETPTTPTTPEATGTNETDVNGSQPEGQ